MIKLPASPRRVVVLLAVTVVAVVSSSCSLFEKTTAVLWTNRPEIAAYVEVFNAEQEKYKIEVSFRQNPAKSLLEEQSPPDIVLGSRLTSSLLRERFQPLDSLLDKELLDPSIFYPRLLAYGKVEEEQILLPVSFSIPVVLFRPDAIPAETDGFSITLDKMKELSAEFTARGGEANGRMGFVTYWEPEFLYAATTLLGARYRETEGGQLAWNNTDLTRGVQELMDWSVSNNGGLESEKRFTERYLYNPGYKLINSRTILFYFMELQDYLTIPDDKRETLDFRWLSDGEGILISEDILFAGIPRGAKGRNVARQFLAWFFTEETQEKLLEAARFKRTRSFGIAQGFSSLVWINEREIPQYYPDLLGHIPPVDRIDFPPPLPIDWTEMKHEVLLPWLEETVVSGRERGSLDGRLQTWLLQRPQ
jgi:hypothetical protein